MNIAFGIIFLLFFYIISYPHAKNLQLCGYDIRYCFKHFYTQPFEFCGKSRLVFTKRVIRLSILYFLILAAVTLPYFILLNNFWWIALIAIMELIFLKGILLLTALILLPFEIFIKNCFIKKARKVLDNYRGIKIGITGSFGKTSTKNFLGQMLKEKYSVCITPKNYNTPMGLCKTALEVLKDETQVLIVEMGARHKGDIKELMQMLHPSYGILTAVGEQHLESFGSLEVIKSTKFELCEQMSKDGIIVFDGNNEITKSLYDKFIGEKYLVGEGGYVQVLEADYSARGTQIKIRLGNKTYYTSTPIIGKDMLSNVCTAAAMALILGVDEESILKVINRLKPAPHRLELITNDFCTIIDDSYNSNLKGGIQACECLKLFSGKKIVISPGLVEQGEKQYELNFKLGKAIGESCDEFIIMNETNKVALTQGALAAGLSKEKLHYALSRKSQIEILKNIQEKGSIVLFENDLPDNYK